MKFALMTLATNLVALAFIAAGIFMIHTHTKGFGWLFLLALLSVGTVQLRTKKTV